MKRPLHVSLLLFSTLFVLPGRAMAQAQLIRADLAPNSHVLVSVGIVRFWFDEPLDPALSHIMILNRQGQQAGVDTGVLNPDNNAEMDVTVPTLSDGLYSVRWTSVSAQDGQVVHGSYLFTVGGPGAAVPPSTPVVITQPNGVSLDESGVMAALAHWLVLLTVALWTGPLALKVLVLMPGRLRTVGQSSLVAIGSRRARPLIWWGLLATLVASAVELVAQAYAATGDWSGAVSAGVLGDVLNTGYGAYLLLRTALVALALLVVSDGAGVLRVAGVRRPAVTGQPLGFLTAWALTLLGMAYLLVLALSGHAAGVPQMVVTSVLFDWLHLVAMAVWVGGMVAIALLLVPIQEQAPELLELLVRFSPAAYLALLIAAATGMFSAQVRIASLDALSGTLYGRLLLIKLGLIVVIMALSASHGFVTCPRLRAQLLDPRSQNWTRTSTSLAARLRAEAALGTVILLCVALMAQVAPRPSVFNTGEEQVTGDQSGTPTAGPVAATGTAGDLTVNLRIDPADIGQTQLTATVTEDGRTVADGQVRIRLGMPDNPSLGAAVIEMTPTTGTYTGTGDLVQEGLWQADVLVRAPGGGSEFRDVPFVFLASPEPEVLGAPSVDHRYSPGTLHLSSVPGAPAILEIRLRPGLRVRFLVTMPDMSPQVDDAKAQAHGWYSGAIVPPMEGYMNLAVQVREGSSWRTVRMTVCQVDSAFALLLLL